MPLFLMPDAFVADLAIDFIALPGNAMLDPAFP
jgi:hypothetical protein